MSNFKLKLKLLGYGCEYTSNLYSQNIVKMCLYMNWKFVSTLRLHQVVVMETYITRRQETTKKTPEIWKSKINLKTDQTRGNTSHL